MPRIEIRKPSGGETWLYKNSIYDSTILSNSLDLKNVTLPFTISDNLTLLGKSSELDFHDGTNFKFKEGDIIAIQLNFFMEIDVTSNAILVELFNNTTSIDSVMIDTNKLIESNHPVVFRNIIIDSSMATNGLHVAFTNKATGGIYIDVYDIFFTITKKGEIK